MTTIVTRTTVGSNTGKGSPLTHTEVDTNFVNLNTAKLETAAIPLGTLGAPSISFLSYSTTGIYSPAGDELGVSMLGSDKIRIKSTGEIIINATASRTTLSTTPRLQIEGSASSNQCSMSLTGAGAGGTLFPRLHLSKARSSVNAIVFQDDILGFISFNGGDGSSLVNAGFIKAEVDGTPSAGIVPGRLVFATVDTAGGSGEHMIIKNNGNVSIVTGNLIIGTAGKGIDFSADGQAAGMTSELLDDYEEGTWTFAVATSTGSVTMNSILNNCWYIKIGALVTVGGSVTVGSVSSPTGAILVTLPFAATDLAEDAEVTAGTVIVNSSVSKNTRDFAIQGLGGTEMRIYIADVASLSSGNQNAQQLQAGSVITFQLSYYSA